MFAARIVKSVRLYGYWLCAGFGTVPRATPIGTRRLTAHGCEYRELRWLSFPVGGFRTAGETVESMSALSHWAPFSTV
jgi:hypothetical protein